MCGAVSAGLLTPLKPALVTETCIGTSPAPARDAGSVNLMVSQPGISGFDWTLKIASPLIAVVPTVTEVISALTAPRTPVRLNSMIVGTDVVPTVVVTVKGSGVRA